MALRGASNLVTTEAAACRTAMPAWPWPQQCRACHYQACALQHRRCDERLLGVIVPEAVRRDQGRYEHYCPNVSASSRWMVWRWLAVHMGPLLLEYDLEMAFVAADPLERNAGVLFEAQNPRQTASSTERALPKAASRGTQMERDRSPSDFLRMLVRVRPVIQPMCCRSNWVHSAGRLRPGNTILTGAAIAYILRCSFMHLDWGTC